MRNGTNLVLLPGRLMHPPQKIRGSLFFSGAFCGVPTVRPAGNSPQRACLETIQSNTKKWLTRFIYKDNTILINACPMVAPYMLHRCLVPLKIWGIYEASMRHLWGILLFATYLPFTRHGSTIRMFLWWLTTGSNHSVTEVKLQQPVNKIGWPWFVDFRRDTLSLPPQ